MISQNIIEQIRRLKKEFDLSKIGKESLLKILSEAELPELVYNSNAIENSTLTLKETERIISELAVARNISVREIFEAKNLARIVEYLDTKSTYKINQENILFLHQMLIGGINDHIAGRLRGPNEYVRVGTHIAPAPEYIPLMLEDLFATYSSNHNLYFLENIAYFHLEFERIHPFNDGNGRMGRILINHQLSELGYPPIIIRNNNKQKDYYPQFYDYQSSKKIEDVKGMAHLFSLLIRESLHKRIAYMESLKIIKVTEYAVQTGQPANRLLNQAKRQTIPAFREKGIWKIGIKVAKW